MARSADDGYTPAHQVEELQEAVLQLLRRTLPGGAVVAARPTPPAAKGSTASPSASEPLVGSDMALSEDESVPVPPPAVLSHGNV